MKNIIHKLCLITLLTITIGCGGGGEAPEFEEFPDFLPNFPKLEGFMIEDIENPALEQAAADWNAALGFELFTFLAIEPDTTPPLETETGEGDPEPAPELPIDVGTNAEIDLDLVSEAYIVITIEPLKDSPFVDPLHTEALTLSTPKHGCHIIINPDNQGSVPLWTHELGHCLGLNHSNDSASIMFPLIDSSQSILAEDVEKLFDRYNNFQ